MPAETVDGMSVVAVRAAAGRAVAHARAGGGPAFLEAITYRYVGHSRSDPGAYRPAGELDAWKERDPITRLRGELVDAGVDPAIVDEIDTEVADAARRHGAQGPRGAVPGAPAHAGVQRVSQDVLRMPRLSDSMSEATIVGWLKRARRERSSAAIRWSRSRRTRRPSSTRPSRTGCSGRSSCPRVESPRSASRSPGSAAATARRLATAVDRPERRRRSAASRRRRPRAGPGAARRDGACASDARGAPDRRARSASRSPGSTARARAAASASWTSCAPDRRRRPRRPATLDLKGPHDRGRAVDDGPDDRAPHDAVAVGDPVVRRRHAGRHVRRSSSSAAAPAISWRRSRRVNDFVVKAAALALREYPAFNSSFVDGRSERHGRVNVGIAVATEDALLVPAVVDADSKPLAVIASETRELAARARDRRLSPRSSRRRRSRSRTWACSACARSPP